MYLTRRLLRYRLDDDHHLLINTLSGALDIIEDGVWKELQSLLATEPDMTVHLDPSVEARLRKRLYLFDTPEDEDRYFQLLFMAMGQRRESAPVQFSICPTYACNLRCVYCFEGELITGPIKIMTREQVDGAFRAIEAIREQFHPSTKDAHIILFGGEPLLRPTYLCVRRILSRAAELGYGAEVVTNGVQVGLFMDLFHTNRAVIKNIQITIDGPAGVHDRRRMYKNGAGTFNAITANVESLLESQLPVTVRINVDKNNIAHVPQLIQFMEDQGWTLYPNFSCYIYPVTAYSDPEQANILHEDQLLYELQRMFRDGGNSLPSFALYGFKVLGHVASVMAPESISLRMPPLYTYCEANGLRYFAFGPDGYIYPCGQSVGQKAMAIGRFHPKLELWQEQCKEWATRSVITIPQCRECAIATLCGGGCAYGAYQRTGSLLMPNCQNSSATLDTYVEHMKEHLIRRYSGIVE